MAKDVIIIGGGHNGLVCACYLARAGRNVTVLERRSVVGGAAVTEEFHPGFRNSVASYTVSLLHPKIIGELNLERHGLRILPRRVNNYLPLPDGRAFVSYPELDRTCASLAQFSQHDAEALPRYYADLDGVVPVIKEIMLQTPPKIIGGGLPDLFSLFRLSRQFSRLSASQQRFLLKLFSLSAADLLDEYFESEPVKALMGFDAVVGHFASPYSPGSAYVLLHHVVGEVNGVTGAWGHAVGGMGAITQAMAREAESLGVSIMTDAEVEQVVVENHRATSIRLRNGQTLTAAIIVANVTPSVLFSQLIDPVHQSEGVREHMQHYRSGSGTFRMNVALNRLPAFSAEMPEMCLEGGIIMAPSLDYMDKAYTDARRQGWSAQPVVEMLIPSLIDDTLAPAGQHVASLFCQHFNPDLGADWDQHREMAADLIISCIERFAPGFTDSVIGRQIHSPWDLERKFGLTGGDIFHGKLSLDQLFSARPMLGMGQYQTEISNLFMCGSGTHPGG
ncbi:MAG: NAD(P)/FAD-dependent oxidoreductase, partial [Pseudomonadales bacterium]|nr:NAD(P)/FAD-dependent oxidoreductase [Pseudomonadales bacterium]